MIARHTGIGRSDDRDRDHARVSAGLGCRPGRHAAMASGTRHAKKALVQARRSRFPKSLEREAEVHAKAAQPVGTLKPNEASFSHSDDRSWKGPWPGRHAAAGWSRITSKPQQHWPGSTPSLSSDTCSSGAVLLMQDAQHPERGQASLQPAGGRPENAPLRTFSNRLLITSGT